ncbi:MAG: insulinase family protein [Bacteroidia bacterium]|nr:insulinase family protein [Bacteroidia bacterium]
MKPFGFFIWIFIITIYCPLLGFAQGKRLSRQPISRVLQTKLDNGLDFIFVENHALPVLSVHLFVKNGAFNQPFSEQGIAYLIEKSISCSNQLYPTPSENQSFFNKNAISFDSETDIEYTRFSLELLSNQITTGLSWLATAVRQPTFDSLIVKQLCTHLGDSLLVRDSDPLFGLQSRLNRLLWKENLYRKQVITDVELLAGYSPVLLRYQYNHYYFPNHCALVISGDGDFGPLYGLVDSLFGSWKPLLMNQYTRFPIPDPKPLKQDTASWREISGGEYSYLTVGWQGPDFQNDPIATISLSVLCELLNFRQSKFQQSLPEKVPGMLYGQFKYTPRKYTGELLFNAALSPEMTKPDVLENFKNYLKEVVAENYFTERELNRARQRVERNWIRSLQKNIDYGREIGIAWATHQPEWIEQRTDILYHLPESALQDVWSNWVLANHFVMAGNVPTEAYQKNFLPLISQTAAKNSYPNTDSTLKETHHDTAITAKSQAIDTLLCIRRNRLQIDVNTRKILQECYKILVKNKLSKMILVTSFEEAKGGSARTRAFQQAITIKNELVRSYKIPYHQIKVLLAPQTVGDDCVKLSMDSGSQK